MAETISLPLFPLGMVAFPGERVNLHVFEPRYRQLVEDCRDRQGTFGIPPYISETMCNYGTELEVTRVAKEYEDGRYDIECQAMGRFKLWGMENPGPGRLYAVGQVERVSLPGGEEQRADLTLEAEVVAMLEQLYESMGARPGEDHFAQRPLSYKLGHKMGLSLDQEYQLLLLLTEQERLELIAAHLRRLLPSLSDVERTRNRIRLNGHFQKFDPLTF